MTYNSGLRLSVFRSFDEAQPAWLALESTADCYAFQTYAWLRNWYDCIGAPAGMTTCITLVETPQGEPIMLLPSGIERRGLAVCLVWLGGHQRLPCPAAG
jgi:CelD/BcsL family acetyltransferase involved in cellulose biosynthesis